MNICDKNLEFAAHLKSLFIYEDHGKLWDLICECDAFVFGGAIKDFIVDKIKIHRDIDIVVEKISNELLEYITRISYEQNRFNGYKLKIGNLAIDLWEIDKTWAFRNGVWDNKPLRESLPSTVFFNATAVIFSLKELKFHYDDKFIDFLNNRILDIVYEQNPSPGFCIVKTYDYCTRYMVELSDRLKEYIVKEFDKNVDKLIEIQKQHYGVVLYSLEELRSFKDNLG